MANKNSTTGTACCKKVGIKRGPWTAEEDEVLSRFVRKEGEGRWRTLPNRAGLLRCGKSCRLRWMNYLRPSVKRGHISPDEEDLILRLHRLLGNRWSLIAGRIPGRTDNEIKNYWNTHLSKKLISQGIDPTTHKPFKAPPSTFNHNRQVPTKLQPSSSSSSSMAKQQAPIAASVVAEGDNNDNNNPVPPTNTRDVEMGVELDFCPDDVYSSFVNSLINDQPPFDEAFFSIVDANVAPSWDYTLPTYAQLDDDPPK